MGTRNKLTAKQVASLTAKGRYPDGGNLYLQVSDGGKSWLFRYMIAGRARSMGLGPVELVTLAEAREKARDCRKMLLDGNDPLEQRQAEREAKAAAEAARRAARRTFKQCVDTYLAEHSDKWSNAKHRRQWQTTLVTYAYPVIGDLPVGDIDTAAVLRVLQPIWATRTETASRLRGGIEMVLAWATVHGLRTGDNPARWNGHLKEALPSRTDLAPVAHLEALPYAQLPAFMQALRGQPGVGARALEFAILTAARSGEVLGARWSEIDLKACTWSVPGERMKAGKPHMVPLSDQVVELLGNLPRSGDLVFEGTRLGRPIADTAMQKVLRRMGCQVTVHGFRSTFRDWAAEQTNHPNHVVEMALAHSIGDKVEASYRRGDLLKKRRKLMSAWARYAG